MKPNMKMPLARVIMRKSKIFMTFNYRHRTWLAFFASVGGLNKALMFFGSLFVAPYNKIVFMIEKQMDMEYATDYCREE